MTTVVVMDTCVETCVYQNTVTYVSVGIQLLLSAVRNTAAPASHVLWVQYRILALQLRELEHARQEYQLCYPRLVMVNVIIILIIKTEMSSLELLKQDITRGHNFHVRVVINVYQKTRYVEE